MQIEEKSAFSSPFEWIGGEERIRALAELVGEVVGFGGEIVFDSSRPDGSPRKLCDVSRLTAAGWVAATPLRQGLALAYADFRERAAGL